MNPKLLAKIGKAFACKKGHGIHFDFFGENMPILIKSESTPEMRAALMPLKQLAIEFSAASDDDKAPTRLDENGDTERPPARGKGKGKGKGKSQVNGKPRARA
jgi:hypothetical protein